MAKKPPASRSMLAAAETFSTRGSRTFGLGVLRLESKSMPSSSEAMRHLLGTPGSAPPACPLSLGRIRKRPDQESVGSGAADGSAATDELGLFLLELFLDAFDFFLGRRLVLDDVARAVGDGLAAPRRRDDVELHGDDHAGEQEQHGGDGDLDDLGVRPAARLGRAAGVADFDAVEQG
eukprot:TRINITY_DN5144_c0_g1_i12.p2 TRINITY_DN5144_c0_g1~~TRINITY_DN5144_c0_g1_i12.p2  ORF type:complete len:178 (-),score=36.12 TRINITY_DN5144_c0_g1_i12:171-704(-)